MAFAKGDKISDLEVVGSRRQTQHGHHAAFLAGREYFDSRQVLALASEYVLRAKAVLCPGLRVSFSDEDVR